MIIQNLENINTNSFDYTVVGSGPAGITLSLQLAQKNKKVLLIEAGGYIFPKIVNYFIRVKLLEINIFNLT